MTDTPRTDAQHAKWRVDDDPYTNMTEFARQLERELNDERNVNSLVDEIRATGAIVRAMPTDAAPQGANEPPFIGTGYKPQAPAVAAPPQMPGLEVIAQLPPPDEQHFHQAMVNRSYASGWNDAIEAAAVYCEKTLAINHPGNSVYFRHCAANIRWLVCK